jgi:hypothetical protein
MASLSTAGGASIGTNAGADQLCLNGACITTWPSGTGTGDNLGNHTATQNINMSGTQVTNLGTPVNATDSATKGYVDGKTMGGSCGVGQVVKSISTTGVPTCVADSTSSSGSVVGGCGSDLSSTYPSLSCWGVSTGASYASCPAGTKRVTMAGSWDPCGGSDSGCGTPGGFVCIKN